MDVAQLGFCDGDGALAVATGTVDVFVGHSAADLTAIGSFEVVVGGVGPARRSFGGTITVEPMEGATEP